MPRFHALTFTGPAVPMFDGYTYVHRDGARYRAQRNADGTATAVIIKGGAALDEWLGEMAREPGHALRTITADSWPSAADFLK